MTESGSRDRLAHTLVVSALVLWGCGGSCLGGGARLREVPSGVPSGAQPNPLERAVASQAQEAAQCPAEAPVLCGEGCCPSGSECSGDGGCFAPLGAIDCPTAWPVRCEAATACGAGLCTSPDLSGHGNDAVLSGGAALGPGLIGTAAVTGEAGTGCPATLGPRISAPTQGFPLGGAAVTIEAWVRTSYPGEQALFGFGEATLGSAERSLTVSADGSWEWPAPCTHAGPPGLAIADGRWHLVVATYSGGVGVVWLDGVDLGSCTVGPAAPQGGTFWIGNRPAGRGHCGFHGEIDEVRVLSGVLSAERIAADFASGSLEVGPEVAGLWKFDSAPSVSCCPSGSSCGSGGSCAPGPSWSEKPQCPALAPVDCGDGGCCAAGQVCTASGCGHASCPPGHPVQCTGAVAYCCPPASSCGNGGCLAADGGQLADGGAMPDGGPLPDGGFAPDGGEAPDGGPPPALDGGSPPIPASCGAGLADCGGVCCQAVPGCTGIGSSCSCAFGGGCRPVRRACPCPSGICGRSFGSSGDQITCVIARKPPATSAGGTACGNGNSCPPNTVCCGTDRCCPPDHPVACGDFACLAAASCVDGQCGCPERQEACGAQCCGEGAQCFAGSCAPGCPTPGYPAPCGATQCCAPAVACSAAGCGCPASHPVACGAICCLPEAACSDGECGCSGGAAACGNACCGAGQKCVGGLSCVDDIEPLFGGLGGGGGSAGGGGGSSSACGKNESPCSSNADCCGTAICVSARACLKSSISGSCDCNDRPTTGVCLDFVSAGKDVRQCGQCASTASCCPGSICVNGKCLSSCD